MGVDRFVRGRALALAIVALALVLLGRVCTAAEDHSIGHDAAPAVCCVMVDEATLSVVKLAPQLESPPLIVRRIAPRLALALSASLPGARPSGASASRTLAYHARSARILS